jgi:hypothetical protein
VANLVGSLAGDRIGSYDFERAAPGHLFDNRCGYLWTLHQNDRFRRPMNTTARASLDATPVPVEGGQPATACVVHTADGWRTAWLTGVRKELFGPTYATARLAAEASRYLNERAA